MVQRTHKKVSCVCIFCGTNKNINVVFIPPLEYSFKPVCTECLPTLERFKKKYKELWND